MLALYALTRQKHKGRTRIGTLIQREQKVACEGRTAVCMQRAVRAWILMQQCVRPTPCSATVSMREYGTSLQAKVGDQSRCYMIILHLLGKLCLAPLYLHLRRPALSVHRSRTHDTPSKELSACLGLL